MALERSSKGVSALSAHAVCTSSIGLGCAKAIWSAHSLSSISPHTASNWARVMILLTGWRDVSEVV